MSRFQQTRKPITDNLTDLDSLAVASNNGVVSTAQNVLPKTRQSRVTFPLPWLKTVMDGKSVASLPDAAKSATDAVADSKPLSTVNKDHTNLDTEKLSIKCAGAVFYAYDEQKRLMILLGQEATNPGWSESSKWSDFTGFVSKHDATVLETVYREIQQETLGIVASGDELRKLIHTGRHWILDSNKVAGNSGATTVPTGLMTGNSGAKPVGAVVMTGNSGDKPVGAVAVTNDVQQHSYHVWIEIPYDTTLPTHYRNVYTFLQTACSVQHPKWSQFKHIPSCQEGTMEKVALGWFAADAIVDDTPVHRATFRADFLGSFKRLYLQFQNS